MTDHIVSSGDKRGKVALCCGAWGFRAFEYPLFFAAAELGFVHVELQVLRVDGSRCHIGPSPSEEELRDRRRAAEKAGVRISVIAGTNDLTFSNEEKVRAEIAFARHQVDVAVALDADILRLFSGRTLYEQLADETYARCYEDPLSAYSLLQDRIVYMQLKDSRWLDGVQEYCSISEGIIGWKRLLPALVEAYRGYWGVE